MEILVAAFIGLWLSGFALWGYLKLRDDYKDVDISSTNADGGKN